MKLSARYVATARRYILILGSLDAMFVRLSSILMTPLGGHIGMLVNICVICLILLAIVVVGSIVILLWTIADKLLDVFCGFTMTEALIDFFDMIIERT